MTTTHNSRNDSKFKHIAVRPFSGYSSPVFIRFFSYFRPILMNFSLNTDTTQLWVWLICDRFPASLSFWAQFPLIRCFFSAQTFLLTFSIFHSSLCLILYIVMSNTNKILSMVPCTYVRCIVDVIGGVAILVSRVYYFYFSCCCWSIWQWNGSVACDSLNDVHVCLCCFVCFIYCRLISKFDSYYCAKRWKKKLLKFIVCSKLKFNFIGRMKNNNNCELNWIIKQKANLIWYFQSNKNSIE